MYDVCNARDLISIKVFRSVLYHTAWWNLIAPFSSLIALYSQRQGLHTSGGSLKRTRHIRTLEKSYHASCCLHCSSCTIQCLPGKHIRPAPTFLQGDGGF